MGANNFRGSIKGMLLQLFMLMPMSDMEPAQALAPYTTQCVGIDISENMVETYNTRAENQVSLICW